MAVNIKQIIAYYLEHDVSAKTEIGCWSGLRTLRTTRM